VFKRLVSQPLIISTDTDSILIAIPPNICKANMIAHVGKIELKGGYNPYYVSTFLNSKYGYYQMRRRGIKATRPEIKLVEFPEIMIPIFSNAFDRNIESTIENAIRILSVSVDMMRGCETNLLNTVGLKIFPTCAIIFALQMFGGITALFPKYTPVFVTTISLGCNSERFNSAFFF